MSKKSPKTFHARHGAGATAIQMDHPDGTRVVAYENLRVLITKEDGSWIAQGVDIDYAVDGDSLQDVKKRFEDGLALTIESNLRVYNSIKPLLRQAPHDVLEQWYDAKNALRRFRHSQAILTTPLQSELPFDQIVWLDATSAA